MTAKPFSTVFKGSPRLWPALDASSKVTAPRLAAIAYVTDDSALPLGEGDLLICDAAPARIAAGHTSAKVLKRLHGKGAKVYSYPGLHAKVLVVGEKLFVGSANHSATSRNLMEAAVESNDPALVGEAIAFIRGLQKDRVNCDKLGPKELKRLGRIKVVRRGRPPRMRRPKVRTTRAQRESNVGWVVACYQTDDPNEPAEVARAQRRIERRAAKSVEAAWYKTQASSKLAKRAQAGQQVVFLWRGAKDAKKIEVYPPVLVMEKVPVRRERAVYFVHPEDSKDRRRLLTLGEFKALLNASGCTRSPSRNSAFTLSKTVLEKLNTNWPRT